MTVPAELAAYGPALTLADKGNELVYTYDTAKSDGGHGDAGIAALLQDLAATGIHFKDLHSSQSSLEDIFVNLVHEKK